MGHSIDCLSSLPLENESPTVWQLHLQRHFYRANCIGAESYGVGYRWVWVLRVDEHYAGPVLLSQVRAAL